MQVSPHHQLSLAHLSSMVHSWTTSHSHFQQLQNKTLFKATLAEIDQISKIINPDIVLYLLLKVLGWLLRDLTHAALLDLNSRIKQFYRHLLLNQYFRHPNLFELFVLLHIKVTVLFMEQHFESIQIEPTLECEFCIILYHAILGVEINEKTYQLLLNRYVFREHKTMKQSVSTHTSFGQETAPKKSIVSLENKSKKTMESKRVIDTHQKNNQKSHKLLRFSKMSFFGQADRHQKQDGRTETIEGILRQHLKVDPLPKLKKKRMNIEEYRRMLTEPGGEEQKQESQQYNDFSPGKHRNKFIFSNQLSTSIKTEYPEQLIFELNSRKVKLNQTAQNFERENRLFQTSHNNNNNNKENLSFYGHATDPEAPPRGKIKVEDWSSLVTDLKKKVYNLKWKDEPVCGCGEGKKRGDGSIESLRRKKKLLSKVSMYSGEMECI